MDKKIQKKAQGDIILPLNTVKNLADRIEKNVQETRNDVEEQQKQITNFNKKVNSIINFIAK